MYEGEINMVIHAGGGEADVEILPTGCPWFSPITVPGIPDVELAMRRAGPLPPTTCAILGFGAGWGLPNIKKYTDYMDIKTEIGKGTRMLLTVLVPKTGG